MPDFLYFNGMKIYKRFATLCVLTFTAALILSSCDPRKNCNHPDHGRYMQEKIAKKRGIPR